VSCLYLSQGIITLLWITNSPFKTDDLCNTITIEFVLVSSTTEFPYLGYLCYALGVYFCYIGTEKYEVQDVARLCVLLGKPHYVGGVDQEHPGLTSHLVRSCKTIPGTADLETSTVCQACFLCGRTLECTYAMWYG